jgi:hypothetical protein
MRWRQPFILTCTLSAGAVALLAAGCGGGAPPGVASIASDTTTATTSTPQSGSGPGGKAAPGPGGKPSPGPGGGQFTTAMKVGNATQGAKFSSCMRKHGVSNFPDPNSKGVIQFGSAQGIDPNSPAFTSAQSACQKLLPNGGAPSPQEKAKSQQKLLAYSECMRAHGIKDFPDPTNGGLRITGRQGSDLTPNNPHFQAAEKACQASSPLGDAGTGGTSTGGN